MVDIYILLQICIYNIRCTFLVNFTESSCSLARLDCMQCMGCVQWRQGRSLIAQCTLPAVMPVQCWNGGFSRGICHCSLCEVPSFNTVIMCMIACRVQCAIRTRNPKTTVHEQIMTIHACNVHCPHIHIYTRDM